METDRIFAYVKRAHPQGGAIADVEPDVPAEAAMLARPLIGALVETVVYDEGETFAYLTRDDADTLGLTVDALFELGRKNLAALTQVREVETLEFGEHCYGLVAGGNFEASFLAVPELWPWLAQNVTESERLLVAAPARDLVAFGADDPGTLAELRQWLAQLREKEIDHRLGDEVFRFDGKRWSVAG